MRYSGSVRKMAIAEKIGSRALRADAKEAGNVRLVIVRGRICHHRPMTCLRVVD